MIAIPFKIYHRYCLETGKKIIETSIPFIHLKTQEEIHEFLQWRGLEEYVWVHEITGAMVYARNAYLATQFLKSNIPECTMQDMRRATTEEEDRFWDNMI